MKHNYNADQINRSLIAASEFHPELRGLQSDAAGAFLSALPEPVSDEWQECGFEDIREGDRVKVVDTHEAGDQTVYEGDVVQVSKGLVVTAHHQLHSVYNSKWYRIPAPVQHPDPAEHPVIIVYEIEGDELMKPASYYWHLDHKHYKPIGNTRMFSLAPEVFTKWEPADIVPKVVADDD